MERSTRTIYQEAIEYGNLLRSSDGASTGKISEIAIAIVEDLVWIEFSL